jgi:hypothetical protein
MKLGGTSVVIRALALIAVGVVASTAFTVATAPKARAQLHGGEFSLYQPSQISTVGRAWCSSDHTIEYWAYVDGEFTFADTSNDSLNRWRLDAEHVSLEEYEDYNAFKSAVLALPEMSGKTVRFQSHAVSEEVVVN